jgi:hypothetical protein
MSAIVVKTDKAAPTAFGIDPQKSLADIDEMPTVLKYVKRDSVTAKD